MLELMEPKHFRRRKTLRGPMQASCCQQIDRNLQGIYELLAFEDIREFCGLWPCRYSTEIALFCLRNLGKSLLKNRLKSFASYSFRR
jgi:hypothetical protein